LQRAEAALHALECVAPALLPAIRPSSFRPNSQTARSSLDSSHNRNSSPGFGQDSQSRQSNGGAAADVALRAAAAAAMGAASPEQV